MQTLYPLPGSSDESWESVLATYAYPTGLGGRWWMRANMLSSVDGAVTGPDGRSGTLATASDKTVFRHLRSLADAVIVGAGTARDENYGPPSTDATTAAQRESAGQRPRPHLVVVTRSLSLDPGARLFASPDRVTVVTSRAADWNAVERLAQVADVLRVGDEQVDLGEMLAVLADRGLTRLLCEGGPALLGDVVADGLLDELCWTLVPTLAGGQARRMVSGRSPDPLFGLSLVGMVRAEDGTMLTRWRRG